MSIGLGGGVDLELNPLSPVPLYQQIRDRIVEGIGLGRLRRGEGLASVRALAAAFAINPATVAKAYAELRSEGLVGMNAKSGTFVARDPDTGPPQPGFVEQWQDRLLTLMAEAHAQGVSTDQLLGAAADIVRSLGTHGPTNEEVS